jgi:hypothetical protein
MGLPVLSCVAGENLNVQAFCQLNQPAGSSSQSVGAVSFIIYPMVN